MGAYNLPHFQGESMQNFLKQTLVQGSTKQEVSLRPEALFCRLLQGERVGVVLQDLKLVLVPGRAECGHCILQSDGMQA